MYLRVPKSTLAAPFSGAVALIISVTVLCISSPRGPGHRPRFRPRARAHESQSGRGGVARRRLRPLYYLVLRLRTVCT